MKNLIKTFHVREIKKLFIQRQGKLNAVTVILILFFCFSGLKDLAVDSLLSADTAPVGTIVGQNEEQGGGISVYQEDIDRNGNVDIFDLLEMLRLFRAEPENPVTDLNSDGKGNIYDLLVLLRSLQNNSFTPRKTYSITGRVVEKGVGVSGVSMVCDGEIWSQTVTDSDGYFRFTGLYEASYVVKPILKSYYYTFEPEEFSVTINGDSLVLPDFAASFAAFTLSGRIVADSLGLGGVSVSVKGEGVDTVLVSDSLGMFRIDSLFAAPYVIVPILEGYNFTPYSFAISMASDSLIQDIQASPIGSTTVVLHTLAGKVYCTVQPLENVTVILLGDMEAGTVTDANGNYSFLVPDGNYTIISLPIPESQMFNPGNHSVVVEGADMLNLDFYGYGAGL